MRRLVLMCAVMMVFTLALVSPAWADQVEYDINIGNAALSGYTGPYATVIVDRTSSTEATITFTSETNSGNIYLLGGNQAADVNVNATSWTIGSFSASNSGTGFTTGTLSDDGGNNVSSFGVFNQTVDNSDGYTQSWDTISFQITNTSGTWSSAGLVLIPNADGYSVGAHIFVTSDPADASNGALVTGYAVATDPVPEPASLLLVGTGLLAWGAFRRHGKKRDA